MKALNFASLDPHLQARGVKGLRGASNADRSIWAEAHDDLFQFAVDSDLAYERVTGVPSTSQIANSPLGTTDKEVTRSERRVQTFFRAAVLAAYEDTCAITGIAVPSLLNAGHIIPWAVNESKRADPRNGIALNALHDRAFDRGLITFDESHRLIVSSDLRVVPVPENHKRMLLDFEGIQMRVPLQHPPDPEALKYHREVVFTP